MKISAIVLSNICIASMGISSLFTFLLFDNVHKRTSDEERAINISIARKCDSLQKIVTGIDSTMSLYHTRSQVINEVKDHFTGCYYYNESCETFMDAAEDIRRWDQMYLFENIYTKQLKHKK